MNTTTATQHHRTAAAAFALAFAVVAAAGVTPSAQARESRFAPEAVTTPSPYAEPVAALGGISLAQYLADHVEHRIHVH
jgi:hypothetical protein